MEVTERFADAVACEVVPLAEAALLIGAHGTGGEDIRPALEQLDALAGSVAEATPEAVIDALFVRQGFRGDARDYYNLENSYLQRVLDRQVGIPITLSVVLIEVGARAGVRFHGLGTPSHFMACTDETPRRFIDPFARGRVLDRAGLERMFSEIAPGVRLGPYLEPVTPLDILRRMLGNILATARQRNEREVQLWAAQLRTLLPGSCGDDLRAFGGALAAAGDFVRAAKVLEEVAGTDGGDAGRELAMARRLRARLN